MSQPNSNALPFPGDIGRAAETTSGGQTPVQWIEIAVGLQPLQASVIKSKLESANIPALIRQESIGSVMGLTIGKLGSASVLAPEDLVDQALEIIAPETFDDEEE